jgi:hypothetical protein
MRRKGPKKWSTLTQRRLSCCFFFAQEFLSGNQTTIVPHHPHSAITSRLWCFLCPELEIAGYLEGMWWRHRNKRSQTGLRFWVENTELRQTLTTMSEMPESLFQATMETALNGTDEMVNNCKNVYKNSAWECFNDAPYFIYTTKIWGNPTDMYSICI